MRPCFGLANYLTAVVAGAALLAAPHRRRANRNAGRRRRHRAPRSASRCARAAGAAIEKVVDGFVFLEGPVWLSAESRLAVLRPARQRDLSMDGGRRRERLREAVLHGRRHGAARRRAERRRARCAKAACSSCVYGSRSVVRLEKDGTRTTLAERFEGKRLNSPNDLVVARDGTVYFTDPSFGLEGMDNSPLRELTFNGVYRLGRTASSTLLTREQERPNGLVLSPDESILYVANSGGAVTGWMAYDLGPERLVEQARVLRRHGCAGRGRRRRHEGRSRRQRLCDGARRRLGHRAGRHASRHDSPARGTDERRLGRRRAARCTSRGARRCIAFG